MTTKPIATLITGASKELALKGIRVNAIRVGTTDTNIHEANGNPDRVKDIASMTPMGRIANPIDIAEAALFLASEKSKFVTWYCVDRGRWAWCLVRIYN